MPKCWRNRLTLAALAAILITSTPCLAQNASLGSRSYLNPFPQTDQYHLHVFGDSLAQGLADGIAEAFNRDGNVKIVNSANWSATLTRPDRYDLAAEMKAVIGSQPIHIAVIMLGLHDARSVRGDSGLIKWDTPDWRPAYGKQIDRVIKLLKEHNIAIYWLGMPIMASAKTNDAMETLNEVFRERTYLGSVKFIDTWSGFTDQIGGYSAYGPDLTGRNYKLRDGDGVHFTRRGYRKLAHYVEVILRRDLATARNERNIPLAGDIEEQARIIAPSRPAGEGPAAQQGQGSEPAEIPGGEAETAGGADTAREQGNGDAAEAGRDSPPSRPVIVGGYAPAGEIIVGEINSGVTALASISPASDLNAKAERQRLPLAERLYHKVLVEGQPLEPKAGRADDFKWPGG